MCRSNTLRHGCTSSLIYISMQLLYTECPTNPTMDVVDLEALADFAQSVPGLVSAVDATFGSPYLLQPLKMGMNISIHSW